jgi:hypothetical protein
MIRYLLALAVCGFLGLGDSNAEASDFFPETFSRDGRDFHLFGKGTREELFVDLYTCALYVEGERGGAGDIIREDRASVVRLQVHGSPPTAIPESWRQVLRQELNDRMVARVRKRYRDFEAGDRVEVTYLPGGHTVVAANGKTLLSDPGFGLMEEMLRQWIGAEPVSASLKESLLGGR